MRSFRAGSVHTEHPQQLEQPGPFLIRDSWSIRRTADIAGYRSGQNVFATRVSGRSWPARNAEQVAARPWRILDGCEHLPYLSMARTEAPPRSTVTAASHRRVKSAQPATTLLSNVASSSCEEASHRRSEAPATICAPRSPPGSNVLAPTQPRDPHESILYRFRNDYHPTAAAAQPHQVSPERPAAH